MSNYRHLSVCFPLTRAITLCLTCFFSLTLTLDYVISRGVQGLVAKQKHHIFVTFKLKVYCDSVGEVVNLEMKIVLRNHILA